MFVCFGGRRSAYRDRQPLSGAQVQRAPSFMLVDEADSILLDEAVTPMILSGQGGTLNPMLMAVDRFVGWLKKAEVQALSDEDEYLRLDGEVDYIGMPRLSAKAGSWRKRASAWRRLTRGTTARRGCPFGKMRTRFCDTEAARRESGSALSGGSPIWKSGSNRSAIYM